jgi:hypothetical protein
MKLVFAMAMMAVLGQVHAAKPCEELKAEIAAKLDAKGVQGYALEIVENDKLGEARPVGSCEAGTKKIIYKKLCQTTGGLKYCISSTDDM